MTLIFEVIRGGGDNLAYVLGCSSSREAAVVDPVSAHDILEYVEKKKLVIRYVLNTHGHPDHTEGNEVIVNATGAKLLAHSAERIKGVKRHISHNYFLPLGKFKLQVLHTPGHTAGSLCFKVQNKLITGDTLFLGGAGNTRFGGNVKDLYRTFSEKLSPLPNKLEVCPGHDYAENNLRFARTLEPDNPSIDRKLKELKDSLRKHTLIRSTLGEERRYNPFFRYRSPELIEALKTEYPELKPDSPFEVFRLIRELKNNW